MKHLCLLIQSPSREADQRRAELKRFGVTAVDAASPGAAETLLCQWHFDAAVIDMDAFLGVSVFMPRLENALACHDVPAILLSDLTKPLEAMHGRGAICDFVLKPTTGRLLALKLCRLIERSALQANGRRRLAS